MVLREQEITALQAGLLDLGPLSCSVTRQASESAPSYAGSGQLRQDKRGHLMLQMLFGPEALGAFGLGSTVVGDLAKPDEYFVADLVDAEGRAWRTSAFLPESRTTLGAGRTTVVHAAIETLECTRSGAPTASDSDLYLLEPLNLPGNARSRSLVDHDGDVTETVGWKRVQVTVDDVRIDITPRATRTRVRVFSVSAKLETQVISALEVVSGRQLRPAVVVTHSPDAITTQIRSYGLGDRAAVHVATVPTNIARTDHIWRLFEDVLRFAMGDSEYSQNVLAAWDGVMRAERGTVDLQALVTTVAVEGIVRAKLPAARARKQDSAWKELQRLASIGEIDPTLPIRWRRLRTEVAHGWKLIGMDIGQVIRELDAVRTLLHQLVFAAVGYQGVFVDSSTRPITNRVFPLQTSAVTDSPET